jgi:hypothetical protein
MLIRRRNGSHPSSFVKGRLRSRVVHGSCGRFGFGSVSCRFCAWLWCSRSNFAASPRGSETTSSTFVRDKLNSLTQLIPGQLPIQGRYASAPASPGFRKPKANDRERKRAPDCSGATYPPSKEPTAFGSAVWAAAGQPNGFGSLEHSVGRVSVGGWGAPDRECRLKDR